MPDNIKNDSRHPYTYACDLIRVVAGYNKGGTKLNRSDASQIIKGIAIAIKMDNEELANLLSQYYQLNEDAFSRQAVELLLNRRNNNGSKC